MPSRSRCLALTRRGWHGDRMATQKSLEKFADASCLHLQDASSWQVGGFSTTETCHVIGGDEPASLTGETNVSEL